MSKEITISGNIKWRPCSFLDDGEYTIVYSNQGWGLPTKNITPEDLRRLADHLEQTRKLQSNR